MAMDFLQVVARMKKLQEALKFYANENNWDDWDENSMSSIEYDTGDKAREALKK